MPPLVFKLLKRLRLLWVFLWTSNFSFHFVCLVFCWLIRDFPAWFFWNKCTSSPSRYLNLQNASYLNTNPSSQSPTIESVYTKSIAHYSLTLVSCFGSSSFQSQTSLPQGISRSTCYGKAAPTSQAPGWFLCSAHTRACSSSPPAPDCWGRLLQLPTGIWTCRTMLASKCLLPLHWAARRNSFRRERGSFCFVVKGCGLLSELFSSGSKSGSLEQVYFCPLIPFFQTDALLLHNCLPSFTFWVWSLDWRKWIVDVVFIAVETPCRSFEVIQRPLRKLPFQVICCSGLSLNFCPQSHGSNARKSSQPDFFLLYPFMRGWKRRGSW